MLLRLYYKMMSPVTDQVHLFIVYTRKLATSKTLGLYDMLLFYSAGDRTQHLTVQWTGALPLSHISCPLYSATWQHYQSCHLVHVQLSLFPLFLFLFLDKM